MSKRLLLFFAINALMVFASGMTLMMAAPGREGPLWSGALALAAVSLVWGSAGAVLSVLLSNEMIRRSAVATKAALTQARADLQQARIQTNTLVRLQVAQGLAPLFFERKRPYENQAELSAMLQDGLLHKAAFVQKPPYLLRFYRRLLPVLERAPEAILEIGVKGGGSTALWKALFPAARVVGLDLKLRPWLEGSDDGVVYVEGNQTDAARLDAIAAEYGPFDLVIDDGSHVSDDQASTMRALLPHVRPGGFYVVEDTHASLKPVDERHKVDYGADVWPDFVLALFERRRTDSLTGPVRPAMQLALDVTPFVDDLIVGKRVLALRRARR